MIQNKAEKIELVPISEIVPHPKNPNKHPEEQIEHLVKQYQYQGFRNPLVVSSATGFLICGHGWLEAAKLAGLETLPVIRQDFKDEAQEYAYMTADNTVGTWATIDLAQINLDTDGLNIEVDMLGLRDWEIPTSGILPEEFFIDAPADDTPKETKNKIVLELVADDYELAQSYIKANKVTPEEIFMREIEK